MLQRRSLGGLERSERTPAVAHLVVHLPHGVPSRRRVAEHLSHHRNLHVTCCAEQSTTSGGAEGAAGADEQTRRSASQLGLERKQLCRNEDRDA